MNLSLLVAGLSHKTAPVELREKLALSAAEQEKILTEGKGNLPAEEVVVLSTCNRTEIYGMSDSDSGDWCSQILKRRFGNENLEKHLYIKRDREMISHLFQVAGGLDSLVVGENEILKQVKDAYHLSKNLGWTGKIFNVLFQRALYVGKLVRTQTAIGQGALSVGSVAVSLSEKIFGDLSASTVLVLGAGKMAEVSARHLLSKKVKSLWVANRSLENARALAEKFQARALSLEEGMEQMVWADIVIASLSLSEPILSREFVAELMARRRNRSLFLVDIAVPRNVESAVNEIDNVYLYNIDDLESIARNNLKHRSGELAKAARLVREKTDEFCEWLRSLKSGDEKSMKHFEALAGAHPPAS